MDPRPARFSEQELAVLRLLSRQFPNTDAALAVIARLSAQLTLPKGTIHVISDVHGEHAKLRHVINNASGTLRPLVERLFAGRMTPEEMRQFLTDLTEEIGTTVASRWATWCSRTSATSWADEKRRPGPWRGAGR